MLCVAFSRRMCCSRVCSVSTKPRRPSTSVVSPAIRPGIRRRYASLRGEEAEARAAEVEPVAERLALADRDVDAEVARRAQDPERERVALDDDERARLLRGRHERLEVLDRAEEVRVLQEDRGDVVAERLARARSASVTPSASGISSIVVPQPALVVASVSRVCGCRPRETRKRVRGRLLELGEVARRRRPRSAPRRRSRSRPAARSAPRSRSGTRTSPAARPARSRAGTACTASGTPSATGSSRRSPARSGRTSRRRGTRSRPRRRRCGREVAQVRVHLLLGLAGRQVERAAEADAPGHVGEQLVDRLGADRREHRAAVVVGGGGVAAHASVQLGLLVGGGVHQAVDLGRVRRAAP